MRLHHRETTILAFTKNRWSIDTRICFNKPKKIAGSDWLGIYLFLCETAPDNLVPCKGWFGTFDCGTDRFGCWVEAYRVGCCAITPRLSLGRHRDIHLTDRISAPMQLPEFAVNTSSLYALWRHSCGHILRQIRPCPGLPIVKFEVR